MSLLLRGVRRRCEPKGIAVEILKPDAVLRAERVPVGQMGDVFSGGQLLTAAIALYCTMAALRSNDRGRDKHRHAGTLFLDNPIGRANATYLLELQRAVSDALGVQLLYTTGLFDTTALAEFPLVIRLRNDADLRAGLKYISVEEHLRPGTAAAGPGRGDHPRRDHGDPHVPPQRGHVLTRTRAAPPARVEGAWAGRVSAWADRRRIRRRGPSAGALRRRRARWEPPAARCRVSGGRACGRPSSRDMRAGRLPGRPPAAAVRRPRGAGRAPCCSARRGPRSAGSTPAG